MGTLIIEQQTSLAFLDAMHVSCAGPVDMRLPGLLLDVSMKKGETSEHSFPSEWNAFAYIAQGSRALCGKLVGKEHAVVLGAGIL
jgi:redox-sensitive bicupin YhaK (pirin superfamily)